MRICTIICVLSLLLLSSFLSASDNVKYASEIKIGALFINSSGLNKLTEGMNTSYGTDFNKLRVPVAFSGSFYIEFFRSRVGVELGYEYANRSSYSSLYEITEYIDYRSVPISLNYRYAFFRAGRLELLAGVNIGFMNVLLSMSNSPEIAETQPYRMGATAFMLGAGLDLYTRLFDSIKLSTSIYYRYASAPAFYYLEGTLRHNNGDTVRFSNGDALTMDLSGIKFSIGIIFEWS